MSLLRCRLEAVMGKRYYRVTLTGEEQARLEGLISRGRAAARKLAHARMLLLLDRSAAGPGWGDAHVAEAVQVSVRSVERVRRRFVEDGLDAALERKASARIYERKLDGAAAGQEALEPAASGR